MTAEVKARLSIYRPFGLIPSAPVNVGSPHAQNHEAIAAWPWLRVRRSSASGTSCASCARWPSVMSSRKSCWASSGGPCGGPGGPAPGPMGGPCGGPGGLAPSAVPLLKHPYPSGGCDGGCDAGEGCPYPAMPKIPFLLVAMTSAVVQVEAVHIRSCLVGLQGIPWLIRLQWGFQRSAYRTL